MNPAGAANPAVRPVEADRPVPIPSMHDSSSPLRYAWFVVALLFPVALLSLLGVLLIHPQESGPSR